MANHHVPQCLAIDCKDLGDYQGARLENNLPEFRGGVFPKCGGDRVVYGYPPEIVAGDASFVGENESLELFIKIFYTEL
jgi:hypothetical protein